MKKFFRWAGIFFAIGFVGCVAIVILTPSSQTPEQKKQIEKQAKKEIIEIRICPKTGVNIRSGPGTNYDKQDVDPLFKGDKLYVLEEKNDWIRFRLTPKAIKLPPYGKDFTFPREKWVDWSGWVRKDLTVSKDE